MKESLRTVRLRDFAAGDQLVRPGRDLYGFPIVYAEDKDGYTSLRADCGKRFEIVAVGPDWMTARDPEGKEITQKNIPHGATALKVVRQ